MSYLLDTNVVSETISRRQEKMVIAWLAQVPAEALFVSVLTLAEIRKGVEKLTDRKRREKLRTWLEHDLPAWFEGRVLPVDLAVADRWGRLLAEVGRPVPSSGSLLPPPLYISSYAWLPECSGPLRFSMPIPSTSALTWAMPPARLSAMSTST